MTAEPPGPGRERVEQRTIIMRSEELFELARHISPRSASEPTPEARRDLVRRGSVPPAGGAGDGPTGLTRWPGMDVICLQYSLAMWRFCVHLRLVWRVDPQTAVATHRIRTVGQTERRRYT